MKRLPLLAILLISSLTLFAQSSAFEAGEPSTRLSCTSIMVGKKASVDGSVMTSHTCDSWYRTWMKVVPAQDYPRDTVTSIWDGRMHTLNYEDRTGMTEKGRIPQVRHTYRYLDTSYPCLNEHQLGIGETTIEGRDTLQNKEGMFMIEELSRIALERCKTAREAIRLMGRLVKEYGYADSGECLTIADPNEVWIFEVFGEGPKKKGGVWAAVRIPDDHVSVSANISRIGALNVKDTLNCLASDNVFEVAKKLKLWDGKGEFSFWKAYSGGNYYGEPKNYSVREHYILSQLAPSLALSDTITELPLSVRPDSLVSLERVSQLLGSYYEGTPLNLSARLTVKGQVSPVANPWIRPDEIAMMAEALGDSTYQNIRTVSVPWCAYSTVIQLRSWLPNEIGGVAWVLLDNPGESPRFPIYCGTTQLPALLDNCGQHSYRDDTALWHFRQTNRMATLRWGTYRKQLEPLRDHFLQRISREDPFVTSTWKQLQSTDPASATDFLNGYSRDFLGAEVMAWDDLYRKLWRQIWAGF